MAELSLNHSSIFLLEGDIKLGLLYSTKLKKAGFSQVRHAKSFGDAKQTLESSTFHLIFVDRMFETPGDGGFEILESIRRRGHKGIVAMTSNQPNLEDLFRAGNMGADDFLVKGPKLDIAEAAVNLLGSGFVGSRGHYEHEIFTRIGLFRSLGLTETEIGMLSQFAMDFPRHKELAQRLGISKAKCYKVFSRIYEKLSSGLLIDNSARLSHLLTICTLYRR